MKDDDRFPSAFEFMIVIVVGIIFIAIIFLRGWC